MQHLRNLLFATLIIFATISSSNSQTTNNDRLTVDRTVLRPVGSNALFNSTSRNSSGDDSDHTEAGFHEDVAPSTECRVFSVDPFTYNKIMKLVKVEPKEVLVEYKLSFRNYTKNPLTTNMTQFYHSNKWSRVTTSHGQTLLSLAFNYGILSMMTLKFGTTTLDIELVDQPAGCMGVANEEQKIASVKYLLMRDFQNVEDGPVTLINEERVCHEVVVGIDGNAYFKDRCYFLDAITKQLSTEDDGESNFWLTLLNALLFIIRFGLLLFSPYLFIEAVESISQENIPYVIKLKDTFVKTIGVAKRDTPLQDIKYHRLIDLRTRKGFHKLKDDAADLIPGQPVKVRFTQYDITVNYKRMLTENIVDVGLLQSLFRAIFKCKIRHIGPFKTCCKTNMIPAMKCCGGERAATPWIRFCRKVANALLIIVIPLPYYLRLWVFYEYECDEVMSRKAIIKLNGLEERYENSLIHYLTPTHWIFIIIYFVYVTTALLLAFVSNQQEEGRMLKIIVGSFRDLRTLNWTETLSMVVSNIVWPLKRYGLLGFLVGIVYWPIALPITLFIGIVYAVPTIYLSIRMIFYSKSAIFERARSRKKNRKYQVNLRSDLDMHNFDADRLLQRVNDQSAMKNNNDDLGLDDIDMKPNDHIKNLRDNISLASTILKYQATNWTRLIVYILSAIMCLVTLYAVVIVLSEVVGCLIEVIVFTIMGIIVNAAALLKYVMLVLMIFVYSCDCFNNMEKKYLKLNKALFNEVKSRIKDLSDVTSLPSYLQENCGFKSQELTEQASHEDPDDIAEKPLNHWMINDLVLFIDSQDMPRIPKQLFDEVCQIRVAGVPGPVFRGLLEAFHQFLKCVLFVLFVFIIVLTFGAVYKISSTNQMLATIVGGFLPMMLKTFLSPPTPDVELGTVSFKSKMDEVIKNFCQFWPIYDLPFELVADENEGDEPAEKKDGGGEYFSKRNQFPVEYEQEQQQMPDTLMYMAGVEVSGAENCVIMNEVPKQRPSVSSMYKDSDKERSGAMNGWKISKLSMMSESSSIKQYKSGSAIRQPLMSIHRNLSNVETPEKVAYKEDREIPCVGGVEENVGKDVVESVCKQTGVKSVRIATENFLDILILLPDKYDDVWLDEWSDIVSRTSRTSRLQVNDPA